MDKVTITKQCHDCKRYKPLSDFGKNTAGRLGVNGRCKYCFNKKARANYKSRKGNILKRSRKGGKDSSYGQVARKIVSEKLLSHRKRNQVLEDAGIDINFNGTDVENIAHAERIDKLLTKAGLGDIRNDSKSALQSCV
jgi:hypothetical protein